MATVLQFINSAADISITPAASTGETVIDPGGSPVTYYMGHVTSASTTTVSFTPTGTANNIYRCGSFITTPCPGGESISLTTSMNIFFHHIYGYESAGPSNAYFVFRAGWLEYTPGTGDVHADYTYHMISNNWRQSGQELGTTAASSQPYGSSSSPGTLGSDFVAVNTAAAFSEGDRLILEWGIRVTTTNTSQVHFEFGGLGDQPDDLDPAHTTAFGSESVWPFNFSESNQDYWGSHAEFTSIRASAIDWANFTSTRAWSDGDWNDASRYVLRRLDGGNQLTVQMWLKQDDDFLYATVQNINDGCIQGSDHYGIFLCGSTNWRSSLAPDEDDYYLYCNINGVQSQTTAPSALVQESGTDTGPRVFRGAAGVTGVVDAFPYGWDPGTWHAGTGVVPRGYQFDAHNETSVFTDTFTGANGTLLPAHDANWNQYFYTATTMEIQTNAARSTASSATGYRYDTSDVNVDQAVEFDWIPDVWTSGAKSGVFLAIKTDLSFKHYEFRITETAVVGTVDFAVIRQEDAVTATTLQTNAGVTGFVAATTYAFRAEYKEGVVRLKLNGYTLLEYNDNGAAYNWAGDVGLHSDNTNVRIDNFACTEMDSNYLSEFWEEGVDFRMCSRGGGDNTCPDPNTGDVSTTANRGRVSFKIRKERLNHWDGYRQIGFGMMSQCDVQGNGVSVFPSSLGVQLNKPTWDYFGNVFLVGDRTTAANAACSSDVDMRPLMGAHLHDSEYPYEQFIVAGCI